MCNTAYINITFIYIYTYVDTHIYMFLSRRLFKKKFENQDHEFLIQIFSLLVTFAFEVFTHYPLGNGKLFPS